MTGASMLALYIIIIMILFIKSTLLSAAYAVIFSGTWLASLPGGVGKEMGAGLVG
jgi:hypothetical protein